MSNEHAKTEAPKYLKQSDLIPGCVYHTGNTDLLYLGQIQHGPHTDIRNHRYMAISNLYLTHTDEIAAVVNGCPDLESMIQALVDNTRNGESLWYQILEISIPAKFTKLVHAYLKKDSPIPESMNLHLKNNLSQYDKTIHFWPADSDKKPNLHGRIYIT